ncbi:MAG: hypothetical protein Q8P32_03830 [Candidatus Komeilibacteria bacterium]|nr:hypothetical protein [Candidatus Komeilibacteria bacterium]
MNRLENFLIDLKLKENLKQFLNSAIYFFDVNKCISAFKNLSEMQKSLTPKAKKIFQEEFPGIMLKLKWVAWSFLQSSELLELLEKHLLITKEFSLEVFHLPEVFRGYLIGIINYEDRDVLKLKIREALLSNHEVLDEKTPVKTIGDWLRNITAQVGQGVFDNLKENEYYIKDQNFIKLKLEDQEFLKNVISAYKYCWYSSQTREGLDDSITIEEDGKLKILEFGRITDVPALDKGDIEVLQYFIDQAEQSQGAMSAGRQAAATAKSQAYQNLQQRYQQILGQLLPNGAVATKGESHIPEVILDQLNNNLALKDTAAVIGNLENLIILKAVSQLIKSRNFIADFSIFVEAHVGQGFKDELNRLTPEVLGLFLQYLLSGKLKLSAEQSAVVGLHLARALGQSGQKDFMTFAYGDLKTGAFKWREVMGENGKLRFK